MFINTVLYNRKSVSNFNFSLVCVGKMKLNLYYKKMTKKPYDNLQEKCKNSVFQTLKICKAFSDFDFTGLRDCLEIRS